MIAYVSLLGIAAFFTAILSATVGVAGGSVLLGLMLALGMAPSLAIPIHAVVQLVSNGSRCIALARHVHWRYFGYLFLGSLPGPFIGVWAFQQLSAPMLKGFIAVAILYATWVPKWGLNKLPGWLAFVVAGFLGGSLGMVIGAVGPMLAPFFLRPGFGRQEIIGTQAMSQAYLHLLKVVAFSVIGISLIDHISVLAPMTLCAIAGTYVGTQFLKSISDKTFSLVYRMVLTGLAVHLIYESLTGLLI